MDFDVEVLFQNKKERIAWNDGIKSTSDELIDHVNMVIDIGIPPFGYQPLWYSQGDYSKDNYYAAILVDFNNSTKIIKPLKGFNEYDPDVIY